MPRTALLLRGATSRSGARILHRLALQRGRWGLIIPGEVAARKPAACGSSVLTIYARSAQDKIALLHLREASMHTSKHILSDKLLHQFAERCGGYDRSLEWLLREAIEGEVFNAGHSERGNDLPVLLSTSKAERVDGGFRFTGHKMFGSLMPVWTRMGLHATWADADGGPKIVHAFLP